MRKEPLLEGQRLLDRLIARLRYREARRRIGPAARDGRVLDIGCGGYPLFLTTVDGAEKYGVDQNVATGFVRHRRQKPITVVHHCLGQKDLPFESDFFDVVILLAVFEHLEAALLVRIHKDIHRVLKPGGLYVLTTPSRRADAVLRGLDRLRLISNTVQEHKDYYYPARILAVLEESGFERQKMRYGYFEWYMNIWATARK